MERMRWGAFVACLALSWGLAQPATASVVDLFGYGARGAGMAGAVVSHPRGHSAVYYNPAALAFERHASFSLGFGRGDFLLEINGQDVDTQEIPALVLGFGAPIPLGGVLERRLTLGLGFVLPQTSVIIADLPRPGTEDFVLVSNRSQTVSIQGALGIRATDWLSFGAGFIALAELRGAIDVAPNDEGRIGSSVQDEVVADYAPVLGMLIKPTPWLSAAVAFHGESVANFSIPVSADLGDQFTLPIPVLNLTGVAQYDPRQVSAEVSWMPTETLQIAAGATWKQWSRFPSPIEYTAVPDDFPAQPPPGFSDTITPRLGVEWAHTSGQWRIEPRGGIAFEPTPVPQQTGNENYLDNNRIISALGLGVIWEQLSFDVALQWHHMPQRTSTKDPEALTDELMVDNPGVPSISHQGNIFFWAVEVGVQL